MKPEMVDAMLKRNPEGNKKRRKTESGMGKVNTQPVFSRSGRDGETSLADSLDVSAGSCQKFLVFNKSTQAFEPITIISINDTVSVTGDNTITSQIGTMPPSAVDAHFLAGDGGVVGDSDSDVGLHMGQLQSSEDEEQENDQDEGMLIIRAMGSEAMEELNSLPESSDEGMLETKPLTTSMTASMTSSMTSSSQPPEWISNIVTDHEEVVQTCSDPLTSPTGSLMHHHTAGTLTASHTLPTELVVCSLSDTEVVQEEIIDTD